MMKNSPDKNDVLNTLSKNELELKQYGVISIGVFGSVAHLKANELSDIDILVAIQKSKKTLRNFLALNDFLENLFGRKVDLVTQESLSEHIGPHIKNSVVYADFEY